MTDNVLFFCWRVNLLLAWRGVFTNNYPDNRPVASYSGAPKLYDFRWCRIPGKYTSFLITRIFSISSLGIGPLPISCSDLEHYSFTEGYKRTLIFRSGVLYDKFYFLIFLFLWDFFSLICKSILQSNFTWFAWVYIGTYYVYNARITVTELNRV